MVLSIETGESDHSNHKLRRMKKEGVVDLFREMEKLHYKLWETKISLGNTAGEQAQRIENLLDDLAIAEAENHKFKSTVQELNESNNKLVKRVKFLEEKQKIAKKNEESPPKLFKKLIEVNTELEKEKEDLIEECKNKNIINEKLVDDIEGLNQEMVDQKHFYEKTLGRQNDRLSLYLTCFYHCNSTLNDLKLADEQLLKDNK
tara:strand:- start:1083 stop:1691 length:609 start_codon:yes stop_codon:yes gene_type:complete